MELYIDREQPKNSEKNLSQRHLVHHKSHMDWPGREPGPRDERPETNHLSHGTVYRRVTAPRYEYWTDVRGQLHTAADLTLSEKIRSQVMNSTKQILL
jgi:hypothetical protein